MTIRYKLEDGVVKKTILARTFRHSKMGEDRPPRHFSETLLKAYYQLECENGSRFRSSYTKNRIKQTHDDAIARYEATGQET